MARNIATIEDANIAIRDLQDQIKFFTNPTILDLKKRRVINASASQDEDDYIVRKELLALRKDLLTEIEKIKTSIHFLEKRVRNLEP